jgi:hypothetical protein
VAAAHTAWTTAGGACAGKCCNLIACSPAPGIGKLRRDTGGCGVPSLAHSLSSMLYKPGQCRECGHTLLLTCCC